MSKVANQIVLQKSNILAHHTFGPSVTPPAVLPTVVPFLVELDSMSAGLVNAYMDNQKIWMQYSSSVPKWLQKQSQSIEFLMLTHAYIASFPGPTQLSITISTASDEKLGGAWKRGYAYIHIRHTSDTHQTPM